MPFYCPFSSSQAPCPSLPPPPQYALRPGLPGTLTQSGRADSSHRECSPGHHSPLQTPDSKQTLLNRQYREVTFSGPPQGLQHSAPQTQIGGEQSWKGICPPGSNECADLGYINGRSAASQREGWAPGLEQTLQEQWVQAWGSPSGEDQDKDRQWGRVQKPHYMRHYKDA